MTDSNLLDYLAEKVASGDLKITKATSVKFCYRCEKYTTYDHICIPKITMEHEHD